jgi:hypothetical protein
MNKQNRKFSNSFFTPLLQKMNRRGSNDEEFSVFLHVIIAVMFAAILIVHVGSLMGGAFIQNQFYLGEMGKVIEGAEPGDEIVLDIAEASRIAEKNDVRNFQQPFIFNFDEREICVERSEGERRCKFYINDIRVVDVKTIVGDEGNLLSFKVVSADRLEGDSA